MDPRDIRMIESFLLKRTILRSTMKLAEKLFRLHLMASTQPFLHMVKLDLVRLM